MTNPFGVEDGRIKKSASVGLKMVAQSPKMPKKAVGAGKSFGPALKRRIKQAKVDNTSAEA